MYFQHDGLDLYYHQMGEGAPIIVLHGGPGMSHLHLLDQLSPLTTNHTLYFLDYGAVGRSGARAGLTLADLAEEVEGLRRHLKLERAAILGHSMGGFIAQEYAAGHPERVERLMLISTAATAPEVAGKQWRRLSLGQRLALIGLMLRKGPAFLRGRTAQMSRAHMRIAGHTYAKHQRHQAAVLDGYLASFETDCASYTSLQNSFSELDLRPLLEGRPRRPTLILCGDGDILMSDKQAELQQLYPSAEFHWLDSGHDPFVEERDRFFHLLTQFLSREVAA